MTTPNHPLAGAIREVTIAVQKAIDDGHRSRMIDADDFCWPSLSASICQSRTRRTKSRSRAPTVASQAQID